MTEARNTTSDAKLVIEGGGGVVSQTRGPFGHVTKIFIASGNRANMWTEFGLNTSCFLFLFDWPVRERDYTFRLSTTGQKKNRTFDRRSGDT